MQKMIMWDLDLIVKENLANKYLLCFRFLLYTQGDAFKLLLIILINVTDGAKDKVVVVVRSGQTSLRICG